MMRCIFGDNQGIVLHISLLKTHVVGAHYNNLQTYNIGFVGGSTFALIFRKSWFICATFHSIHLRAYFSHVNVMIALIVFY